MKYLKWTAPGRVPSYQGGAPLPEPGEWTTTIENPVLCRTGWHACRWEDAVHHLAAELWVCELGGRIVEGRPDKVVAERLRLVERVPISDAQWRHFAADCAESVLHLFESACPGDDRPRLAIQAASGVADGKIAAAARAAARDAAWAAARDAAWAAAGDAARAAAWAAAGGAARAAAWDAARAAARAAAGDAARDAAWDAAGDAARVAAGDGVWWRSMVADAARDAARVAQSTMLLARLGLDPTEYAHRTKEGQ